MFQNNISRIKANAIFQNNCWNKNSIMRIKSFKAMQNKEYRQCDKNKMFQNNIDRTKTSKIFQNKSLIIKCFTII